MNDLTRKLQIKEGSGLWVWPADVSTDIVDADRAELPDADVALVFTEDKAAVEKAFAEHAEDLASLRAVWIVYAKGNRTDINRDTLWVQLAGYGWKAVSQVSYDETLSALRVRPLKDGEPSPV